MHLFIIGQLTNYRQLRQNTILMWRLIPQHVSQIPPSEVAMVFAAFPGVLARHIIDGPINRNVCWLTILTIKFS